MGPVGKKRSAGINILLFIVTLGIYWWVWLWKAFGELERHKGANLRRTMFLIPMILVWVIMLGIAGANGAAQIKKFADQASKSDPNAAPNFAQFQPTYGALYFAGAALGIVLYGLQLAFLLPATKLVAASVPPGTEAPAVGLVMGFNIAFMAGPIPVLGGLASLAGLILAIVWVVKTQQALNAIWGGPEVTLPPMGMPSAPLMR
jgi:hypothetical protein